MMERAKRWLLDRLGITAVAATADRASASVDDLRQRSSVSEQHVTSLVHEVGAAQVRLEELDRRLRVTEMTAWAATAPLRRHLTVSVVLPTRDRADLVRSAIDSVRAQTYERWELIVVDDGSTDDTAALLAALTADDDRLRVETTPGLGAAAARNVALSAASGEVVAFVDDDNTMHPGWLRAVVEHLGRHPTCRAVFGAQLREDPLGDEPTPRLWFRPDSTLAGLRRDNAIDLGVLAVGRDHPELHFDEALDRYIDWEMIVRIMATTGIEPLPVLASCYTVRASDRITGPDDERLDAMRSRLATWRPPASG